jgi:hypothetical protein
MTTLSADAYVRIPDEYRAATLVPGDRPLPGRNPDGFLEHFEVRRLPDSRECPDPGSWFSDASGGHRRTGGCFALQASATADAVIFFLNHQLNYGLVRLADDDCARQTLARIVRADERVNHPLPLDVLQSGDWSESDGWSLSPRADTYYAIAATDSKAARALSAHIGRLPQRCSASVRQGLEGDALRNWLDELTGITKRWSPAIDWRSLRVKDVY